MHYSINGGSVSYGANTILNDIHFEIKNNERVAVVGRNGCGKTTFLKLINGELLLENSAESSKVSISKSTHTTIGYLKQITFEDYSETMENEVKKAFKYLLSIKDELNILTKKMQTDHSNKTVQKYTDLEEEFNLLGGYYYEKEFETVIKKFGFTKNDKLKRLNEFSGGQCTKIAFAKLLLSKPDILLLDEPTNHLDIETIEWLEGYLKNYPKAIIIVSHDQMFLDKTADIVYEIEYGNMKRYVGNYSNFKKFKKAAYEKQLKDYELQQAEIKRLNATIERFRYKATKASMVQSKIKNLEHMNLIDAPEKYDLRTFFSQCTPSKESGFDVLSVKDMQIGYDTALSTISLFMKKHQKIGIIGGNGLGKSTFLKTLIGKISPLRGNYKFGTNVQIGYFDQQLTLYKSDKTIFDDYSDEFPALTQTEVRNDLGAFVFRGEDVFKKINMLSGGEKVRLALCKILKRKPNFLILDEPTNHMDIVGKESLENILKNFPGSILCVSHDRYFIKQICDSLLIFDKGTVKYYPYNYDDYIQEKQQNESFNEKEKNNQKSKTKKNKFITPLKQLNNLKKQVEKAEQKISSYEIEIKNLNEALACPDNSSDYQKLTELQNSINEKENELLNIMHKWEILNEDLNLLNKNLSEN